MTFPKFSSCITKVITLGQKSNGIENIFLEVIFLKNDMNSVSTYPLHNDQQKLFCNSTV